MGGAFLSKPVTAKKTCRYQHSKIRVITCQMQGWRKHMQDAILFHRISKQIFLFAVFDGHGGAQVSQYCAQIMPRILQSNANYKTGNYSQALQQTFKELDDILGTQQSEEILKNITKRMGLDPFQNSKVAQSVGCTANVALLVDKTLYVANAGDSRCALSRLGSIIELSTDHKPQNPIQLQRIISSGSIVEGGRINNHLNLSRSLGDLYYKKNEHLPYHRQTLTGHPDVKVIQLTKSDDFFLLACDGVWQRYENVPQQLITRIRKDRLSGKSPQQTLEDMLDSFLGKDPNKQQFGCDNMSLIMIQLNKNVF